MQNALELRPGRFSDRFLAYLCDALPFAAGAVLTTWAWAGPLGREGSRGELAAIGAGWAALAVLWQFAGNVSGATPGKRLLGLRVVDARGETPGAGRSLARALGWLLSTPLASAGFLLALVHPRTRTLHDLLAGTYVVEAAPGRSSGVLAFVLALAAAAALAGVQLASRLAAPSEEDLAAVRRARAALEVLARVEEAHKAEHGAYTDSVDELAAASGDPETFRAALLEVFAPAPFRLQAGNRRWRVTAAARDRRRTLVRREGP